jgi:hypothetical protein
MSDAFRSKPQPPAKFPLATVIYYGPTASLATKLVASVIPRRDADPSAVRKWTTVAVDVRTDPVIAEELLAFLQEHRVRQTAMHDRIVGCPHEEGIDYPMGRACPRCPFWEAIDRFTYEPIVPPVATMSPDEVLDELSLDPVSPPVEALESADAHREALIEPLLAAMDRALSDPRGASSEDASLFSYALYLFAKWRERRAYPSVVRWLSLPDGEPFEIGGDIVTEDGAVILASVCDGNVTPIERLIVNRDADQFGRGNGVTALALLAAWLERPREPIVAHLEWLAREGLEREPSQVWHDLATASLDLEVPSMFPDIRRAMAEALIDPRYVSQAQLDAAAVAVPGERLREFREAHPPISDVAEAIDWWGGFHPPEPRRVMKVGRNDPCPCGSGKKYKKCCGAA